MIASETARRWEKQTKTDEPLPELELWIAAKEKWVNFPRVCGDCQEKLS
jgi:hypothetical protein